jgi:lipopolysaccharide/colanic/teichoic acid biosynthesis glycosyltransferase
MDSSEVSTILWTSPIAAICRVVAFRVLKRGLDLFGAITMLMLLSPILLILFFYARRDGGPAFYCQERVGRNGVIFHCWKFRTMVVDAEMILQTILDRDADARREFELYAKLRADPRITPGGGYLRKHSLDELPQIWNVLIGDMSLVGPRPRSLQEYASIAERRGCCDLYTNVRPGLTGLWQVTARNNCRISEKSEIDRSYVEQMSMRGDVSLLLRTVKVVISGDGAA